MLNPAWWFVRGFGRAFFGVSQGASRLQEVLADRWAAFAYGSADFEEGLAHVIGRGVRFEAHVDATLGEVMKTKAALPNLYAFVPETVTTERDIASAVDKVMTEAPSAYDSHPAPAARFAWVRALAAQGPERTREDDAEAWTLFASRAGLEAQMTAEVRKRVLDVRGVVVPAA